MSLFFSATANKKAGGGVIGDIGLISAGVQHSTFVSGSSGRMWAWGANSVGQLGDNTTTQKLTPVSVLGAVKTFCQIASDDNHTMAIDKNGRLWAWGWNTNGQLGDNTLVQKQTPISVLGTVKTFCQIANSTRFSMAIDKNGRAWGWGYNGNGQLGINNTVPLSVLTPVSVLGTVKTFCKINTGGTVGLAIDKNGRAWGWGLNISGTLGDNTTTQRLTPVSVLGAVKTFCEISAGTYGHVVAIAKNGRVWGWGYNIYGQIGDNTVISKLTPVSILGAVKTFCHISAGDYHTMAIDKNGRAWGWGRGDSGQLGTGLTTISVLTPVAVYGNKTFCKIHAATGYTLAIEKSGKVWAWGSNGNGQMGVGTTDINRITPANINGAAKTFCTINVTNGIDNYGRAWGWGSNGYGQIGNNTTTAVNSPVSVLGAVKTFCKIASSADHTVAIDKNGRAWAWGINASGQLGDNTTTQRLTPVSVLGAVKTFCEISAGFTIFFQSDASAAIDKNGRVWTWGDGFYGALGRNATTNQSTPVSVLGAVKTFCKISSGVARVMAIDKNGRAWAWGYNLYGQLGNNSTLSRLTPVSVLGAVKTFCHISAGDYHTMAIDKNGRAWGWGYNVAGELGNNSTLSRLTPVSVLGAVKTFCHISAGKNSFGAHTMAIDKNGRAWGWGNNTNGQLGDATTTSKLTPVSVLGAVKTFCKIMASAQFTIAIDQYGKAWGWGSSANSATTFNSKTPVQICNL